MQLCGVTKGVDKKIDGCILRWFGHVEMMENDKSVCVGVCGSSRSVGRPRKRWIDTMKDCLKKRGLDVRQARRMGRDRIACRGFLRGNAWGVSPGDEPWNLTRCHRYMKI